MIAQRELRNHKEKRKIMSLTPPKQEVWFIAVILGVLGILATLVTIPGITGIAFWLVAVAFILLALATAIKDL
jgi:hypothetical protein